MLESIGPTQPHRTFDLPMLQLLAGAVEHTLQGVIVTDAAGKIIYVNPAFTWSTGYTYEEAKGQNPSLLQSGRHDIEFYKGMWKEVAESGQWQGEIWNRRKNGEIYVEWLNISAIRGENGAITNYTAVFSEITERKQVELKLKAENRRLEQLSLIDSLTGVSNRRGFDKGIVREWERSLTYSLPLSLLLTDIDYFKLYNDLYGHPQGDECLRLVARTMESALKRPSDFLSRYGGEEFAVILPDLDIEGAIIAAQTLREAVAGARLPHKGSVVSSYVTISVGCASVIPTPEQSVEDLIAAADKALYAAKEKGRNRVQIRA